MHLRPCGAPRPSKYRECRDPYTAPRAFWRFHVCVFCSLIHFGPSTLAQALSLLTCILGCSFGILFGSPNVLSHFVVYSALPSKYQVRTSYYVTTASFHVLSNSLFNNYSTIRFCITLIHPIKASGHYMYRQFNIQQFYVLPTQCIYVFCVDLRTNSDYFPK